MPFQGLNEHVSDNQAHKVTGPREQEAKTQTHSHWLCRNKGEPERNSGEDETRRGHRASVPIKEHLDMAVVGN